MTLLATMFAATQTAAQQPPPLTDSHPTLQWFLIVLAILFLLLMGALCVLLLKLMWTGKIDLSRILDEENGGASMSRFQLLLFTLVVCVGLFLYILNHMSLPDIPASILTLLGISASTYAAGKGIQFSRESGVTGQPPSTPDPNAPQQ